MSTQREIVGIQYLRGVAACAVAFSHADVMAGFDKYFGQNAWGGWLDKGALGVDLFFMISGFIIAIVSLQHPSAQPPMTVLEFARRRVFRILPMMWLAIVSYAVFRFATRGTFEPGPYLTALFLVPVGDVEPNHMWTLRHEAIFYCLFAVSFLSARGLKWVILLWILAPFAYAATSLQPGDPAFLAQLARTLAHPANVEFGAGLLCGMIWIRWGSGWSVRIPWLAALSTLYFIGVMAVGNWLDLGVDKVWRTTTSALLFAPLLAASVWGRDRPNRFMELLGNASFSIYLFHAHAVSGVLGVWSRVLPQTPIEVVVVATAIVAILVGVCIHLVVEKPLQAWLERWWRRRVRNREVVAAG